MAADGKVIEAVVLSTQDESPSTDSAWSPAWAARLENTGDRGSCAWGVVYGAMDLESMVKVVWFSCEARWLANFETRASRGCDAPELEVEEDAVG